MCWLAAATLWSCLPTKDLSNYAGGEPPGEPEIDLTDSVPRASEPDASASLRDAGAEPDPGSECGGECVDPPLDLPERDSGTGGVVTEPGDAGAPEAAAPETGSPAPSCAAGAALGPGDRCFVLAGASGWDAARLSCQSRGAGWDLAVIRDAERNAWLVELMGSVTDAWVGATDLVSEGEWRWLAESTPFWSGTGSAGSSVGGAYERWNDGDPPEPNGSNDSNCMRLRTGGGWADYQCSAEYTAICEGPAL